MLADSKALALQCVESMSGIERAVNPTLAKIAACQGSELQHDHMKGTNRNSSGRAATNIRAFPREHLFIALSINVQMCLPDRL
jgi:hypothetical protein